MIRGPERRETVREPNGRVRRLGAFGLGVVLLFMMAACTASSPVAGPASSVPETIPEGWRTFTDPAAPFTLRYPEDVYFSAGQSKQGVYTARLQFQLPDVEGYQGMLIRVEPNAEGHGIEQIVGDLYKRYTEGELPAALLADAQALVLSGQTGMRVTGLTGASEDFTVVLPYGDRVFLIAPVHDMISPSIDRQALELFSQILATLEVRP